MLAIRLGGAGLVGMGLAFWEVTTRPVIPRLASVAVILSHALLAGRTVWKLCGRQPDCPGLDRSGSSGCAFPVLSVCVVLPFAYLREDITP